MRWSYLASLVVPGSGKGAEGWGGVVAVEVGEVREVPTETVLSSGHQTVRLTVVHLELQNSNILTEIVIKILTSSGKTEFT